MVGLTASEAGTLVLLAQERAQPSADELVEHDKGAGMCVLKVAEPATQRPIEVSDDAREAVAARASRLHPDAVLEAGQALLADQTPTGFEPIAEEVEAFPGIPAIADMGLVRMQTQAVVVDEGTNLRQGGLGLFAALAENHEVVRIAHHPIAARCHPLVQRMQIDVCQQRA